MSLFESASLCITPNGTKASKLYAIKPTDGSGDLSVTRATTATRVNSAGLIESVATNVPRLDYSNGTCPSILVEPQRTNLITYSEDFTDASWVKIGASINSNSIISPNGLATADKIIEDTSNSAHFTVKSFFYTGSNTLSVFLKKAERDKVIIQLANSTSVYYAKLVDLTNGTLLTPPSPFTNISNSSIKDFGNGWYRVDITLNDVILEAAFFLYNGSSYTYTGDGTSGLYLWGAQIELGSYSTSYIPTTSASVTRNADVISKTGISSLIGQTEGTMFVDIDFKQGIESFIFGSGNGSYFNNLAVECYSNKAYLTIFNNSASLQGTIESTVLTTGKHKLAVAYNSTQVIFYLDGVSVGTLGAVTFPSFNNFYLGNLGSDTNPKNININTASVWKTRLSNTQLAELTTI